MPCERPARCAKHVRNIQTLEQLTRLMAVPAADRVSMARVLSTFPVRITPHLQRLIERSPAVARQYLPDVREVTALAGQRVCFSGLLPTGVEGVERMYPDRCIIMPHGGCPAFCRFCFRKFYEHGHGSALSDAQIDQAVAFVAAEASIREVLITGGEPVQSKARLARLMDGLRRIGPRVGTLRVACRSLVTAPDLIDDELVALLADHQDLRAGLPVEVACHANHPDEISPETVDALARLREAGIHVYNQAVLLRGINCDPAGDTLLELLSRLRRHGVESYYLFFAGPVLGMEHLRPTLAEALAVKGALRRRASGRLNPHLIVTTRLGKVELGVDGWIVEHEPDHRHVWIRTSYTLEGLREIWAGFELPADARLDDQGFVVMRYLDGPATPAADAPG